MKLVLWDAENDDTKLEARHILLMFDAPVNCDEHIKAPLGDGQEGPKQGEPRTPMLEYGYASL